MEPPLGIDSRIMHEKKAKIADREISGTDP